MQAAETQTGVRLRQRPEPVQARLQHQQLREKRIGRLMEQQQAKQEHLQAVQPNLIGKLYHAERLHSEPVSPAKQARLQAQVAGRHGRRPRLTSQIPHAQRVLAEHQRRLDEQQAQLAELFAWQAQLEGDNQTNPNPRPDIEARLNDGFACGENLTWLSEMGYWLTTKAPNVRTTAALQAHLPPAANGRRWGRMPRWS